MQDGSAGAVRRPGLVGLGVRLAVGGGRRELARLLLVASGVAVGTALLIGGLGVPHAISARHAREEARSPIPATGHRTTNVLLLASAMDWVQGRELLRVTVAAVGRAPVPPGLARLPRPGELAVSPALDRILSAPGAEHIRRLPGRIVGAVGPAGLAFPGELVAYVGVEPESLPPRTGLRSGLAGGVAVVRFGPGPTVAPPPLSLGLKLLILLSVLGLVVPTLVFVATSTRLSAATRERRLAAIRLVGATPGELGLLAAVEAGVAAVIGAAAGLVVFFILRPVVAAAPLAGYRWFPSDIAPPVAGVVAVLALAPLLAVAVALLSLRRLIVSPLGVVRRGRVRRVGSGRLVPLAAGLTGLGICWAYRPTVQRGGTGSILGLGISFALVVAGIAVAAPWPAGALAEAVARGSRRVGTLIGARRLQSDAGASGRVVMAFALLVFVGGIVHSLVPGAASETGGPDIATHLRSSALLVDRLLLPSRGLSTALGGVPGVTAVAPLGRVDVARAGTALVADCAALRATLEASFPRCSRSTVYLANDVPASMLRVRPGQALKITSWPDERLRARIRLRVPLERSSLSASVGNVLVVPPALLPAAFRRHLLADRVLVATDGSATTAERVRHVVARLGPWAETSTLDQVRAGRMHHVRQLTALVDLAILVGLGIALANLAVVSVDHVQERRRPFAVLSACGVPARALVRSVAVEVVVPLLSAVVGAAALAVLVAILLGRIVGSPIGIPVGRLGALVALAIAVVTAVTLLTVPSIGRATRPESLQME